MVTLPSGASLTGDVESSTPAVAVLMHGSTLGFTSLPAWMAPAPWRMQLFAAGIDRRSGSRIAVLRLRYPDRDLRSQFRGALRDTAAALAHIQQIAPRARIGLVGHSNGGRVALRLSADARIHAVAALAPWLLPSDRIKPRRGTPLLLMHGSLDFVTSPRLTAELAARLRHGGADVDYESVSGDNHFLLAQAAYWHSRVADFMTRHLVDD